MAMTTDEGAAPIARTPIALTGARKARGNLTQARIRWVILGLIIIFAIVGGRLIQLGSIVTDTTIEGQARDVISATRPAILDRNGIEMAVDIRVPSLFAEPRRIIDVDEAVAKLHDVLPELSLDYLRSRLSGDKGFVWIKRELTPAIEEKVNHLGIPGLDFVTESKRFYPGGPEASHILGSVNIDNQGIAGIERTMDQEDVALLQSLGLARGQTLTPVTLSVDMRIQHIMREQLVDSLTRYQAAASAAAMINIKTGEIIAMSSLPDFDPNDPATALEGGRMNRITAGKYELGSTFKTITFAGALDSGAVKITDSFDARFGVRFGRFTITDFHGQNRILTVPEIYKYSSNVGTIHMMQTWGKDNYRAFIHKIGFDDPSPLELPEKTGSNIPAKFSDVVAATASFGHGLAITPLHMLSAVAAFVNDGNYVPPTIYKRSEAQAKALYKPLISEHTSQLIRYLFRLNALEGSGSRAEKFAGGYRIGGKTGTAEKVVNGRYSTTLNFNAFASAFPMDNPQYAMIVIIDQPHRENPQTGDTAGWNAGEIAGRIVQQSAPLLGIAPDYSTVLDDELTPVELR
jgi:cell division protein FtsI (penicillin-binding protein 3)